jgi:GDP-4-dehydro-6-deoxy-D-mannose reductase
MDKYLITGFSGFVSKHFLEYIESLQEPATVIGIDINEPVFDYMDYEHVKCSFNQIDLLDKGRVDSIIYDFQPNYILHLASYSSVAYSWKNPVSSFSNNTNIFLNLLEQIRALNLNCRILSVGSSEEYGNVDPADVPLHEEHSLKPLSPYAVARVSQEMLSKVYVDGYGLDIVLTRSFNHIGPGQRDVFVISSFAKQLVEIKKLGRPAEIVTGNLSIIRDFLDVRDVVRAYHFLFKKGKKGEIYNICSGKGVTLKEIVNKMAKLLDLNVVTTTDANLVRPNDNSIIIGNNEKVTTATGWHVNYNLEQSLKDILEYWYQLV